MAWPLLPLYLVQIFSLSLSFWNQCSFLRVRHKVKGKRGERRAFYVNVFWFCIGDMKGEPG
jgi:hypothetical protein